MQCNALWVTDYQTLDIRSRTVTPVQSKELLIQTKACGVCCWDAFQYLGQSGPGPYPYVIGHEAAGIVVDVGAEVTKFQKGDKVACTGGSVVEMSEFFVIDESCVSLLPPDTVDYTPWVIEPACTVQNVMNWANIVAGEHVVVIGAGYMGQLTLMALQAYPWGELTVFETREDRIDMAKAYGATRVLNPESTQGEDYIQKLIAQGGADNVIEFSASESGFQLALRIMRTQQARLTVGSWHRSDMTFDGTRFHMGGLIMNNVSPSTTFHYSDVISQTTALIKRGIYEPGKLVTHVADFSDLSACKKVFDRAVDKKDGYLKGVITFN